MEAEYYDEEMHSEEDAEFEEYYDHDQDVVAAPALTRSDSYTLLKPGELEARQQRTIDEMAELLGVTPSEAGVLLRHYKWNKNALQEAWFDNEPGVRRKVGLGQGEAPAPPALVTCPVCYDDVPAGRTYALSCGHRLCADCWAGYVNNQVEEGPNCIFATCPDPSCPEVVPDDVVRMFAAPALLDKYRRYVLHSYVDHNKNVKWCPSPGCQNAVEYPSRGAREIRCSCGGIFCFNCEQEGHRPTDCETVVRWGMKNSAESENVTWILANTKQCPICRKPIEKNQGCNHMTCFKNAGGCGHEFCWLCLGPWTEHGSSTGGYYKCNKYDKAVKEGKMKEDERARVKAKTELDKYMFYFERYINHEQARKMAQKQRPAIESKMQLLHDLKGYPISELQFLLDALEQLSECRRVLKWTYPFGYYLVGGAEKNLFEHLQQQLEENTEHLHEMLEKPLDPFLDPAQPDRAPFYAYKSELTNYSNVTKKFLHNLLEGIDNGLTSEM